MRAVLSTWVLVVALVSGGSGCATPGPPTGVFADGVWTNDALGMSVVLPEGWLRLSDRDLATLVGAGAADQPVEALFGMHDTTGAPLQRIFIVMRASMPQPGARVEHIDIDFAAAARSAPMPAEVGESSGRVLRCWQDRVFAEYGYGLQTQGQEVAVRQGLFVLGDRLATLQLIEGEPRDGAWDEVLAAIRLDPALPPPEPCEAS